MTQPIDWSNSTANQNIANLEEGFSIRIASNRLLIRIDDAPKAVGRILVPDSARTRPTTGTIIAIGKGIENYFVGEKVVYGMYSGTLLRFKNQPVLRSLVEDEILGAIASGTAELEDTAA